MAFSRLEKIGNIYTRITGLLRSGAMRWEDRPLFYDIYTAFPPLNEQKYMDDPAKLKLRKIFYEEDNERATRDYSNLQAFDMHEKQRPLRIETKRFNAFQQQQQQPPDEKPKEKIFDLQSIDFNKD